MQNFLCIIVIWTQFSTYFWVSFWNTIGCWNVVGAGRIGGLPCFLVNAYRRVGVGISCRTLSPGDWSLTVVDRHLVRVSDKYNTPYTNQYLLIGKSYVIKSYKYMEIIKEHRHAEQTDLSNKTKSKTENL